MTWRMMVPFSARQLPTGNADPFVALHRQMNRAFDDLLGTLPQAAEMQSFKLDVKEDDQAYHLTAELPGMNEKEVEVTFNEGLLTIQGEHKIERDEKKDTWHIIERSSGSFSRQLTLPKNIQADKINARFEKGVLHITLPKMPDGDGHRRKIEIKAG